MPHKSFTTLFGEWFLNWHDSKYWYFKHDKEFLEKFEISVMKIIVILSVSIQRETFWNTYKKFMKSLNCLSLGSSLNDQNFSLFLSCLYIIMPWEEYLNNHKIKNSIRLFYEWLFFKIEYNFLFFKNLTLQRVFLCYTKISWLIYIFHIPYLNITLYSTK